MTPDPDLAELAEHTHRVIECDARLMLHCHARAVREGTIPREEIMQPAKRYDQGEMPHSGVIYWFVLGITMVGGVIGCWALIEAVIWIIKRMIP